MYYNQNIENFKQILRLHADRLDILNADAYEAAEKVDAAFWKFAKAEKDPSVSEEDFQKLEMAYEQAMACRDELEQQAQLEQKFLFHAQEALDAWEMLDSEFRPGI